MKLSLVTLLLLIVSVAFAQDYVVKPDGTKIDGKIFAMWRNNLKIRNNEGEILAFKIDRLSVVHIADPDFKMNGVHLNKTNYEKNDDGIHIVMLNNPIVRSKKDLNYAIHHNKRNTEGKTSNGNVSTDKSSSLSITSDGDKLKAKVILYCNDCSTSGTLVMESEDKLSNVTWTFDCKNGSAFPMEMEIDTDKNYYFLYKDGNNKSIEKKVNIGEGLNTIRVFE
jgi:hypothetical protein